MAIDTFPVLPGAGWPVGRSASGLLTRNETLSGRRTMIPLRTIPRYTWTVPYEFLFGALWYDGNGAVGTYAQLETLVAFFNQRATFGDVFKYQDPQDCAAVDQLFGLGDGDTTTFQLVRAYGGFAEPVYSASGVTIKDAGTPVTPGTFSVSTKGVVTFDTPPADGDSLTWSGTYYWYCRFDSDSLDLQMFMQGANETAQPLKFSSEIVL